MLKFGKLEIVEKTFTREGGATREQLYKGVKFRRYESVAGKKKAEEEGKTFEPVVKTEFVVSNDLFEKMNLENYALIQAKDNGIVYLLVVEDQDAVEPAAKFMRRSISKKGDTLEKGKKFTNEFLVKDLEESGVLEVNKYGNQFIAASDITSQTEDLPSVVKAVYQLSVDTSITAEAEAAEAAADEKF